MNKTSKRVFLLIEGEHSPTMATVTDQLCEECIKEKLSPIIKISKINVLVNRQSSARCTQ
jgi:hypothetical protein